MITEKIRLIADKRTELAALEKEVETEKREELLKLPRNYGFETAKALYEAILAAQRKRSRTPSGKPRKARAVITDEIRQTVERMTAERIPIAKIMEATGLSSASVVNIRKQTAPNNSP